MFVLWANHATKSIYISGGRVCEVVRDKGEDLRKQKWGVVRERVLEGASQEKKQKGGRRRLKTK